VSTSNDYRTPLFFINGELLADGSVPPDKLQPGIPGSLLQDGSVPPGKLQSGIPGSLLQNGSVPLGVFAPEVSSRLRLHHSAPLAAYPDTSKGLYRLINAYRGENINSASPFQNNILIVVPVILDEDVNLGTAYLVCSSLTSSGEVQVGIYNEAGNRLANATFSVAGTGLISASFSSTVNVNAGRLYYLGFLKTSGNFNLNAVEYGSLEYVKVSGTNLFRVGVMVFSTFSLPTFLSGLNLSGLDWYRAPALITSY